MTYDSEKSRIGNKPITIVELLLDDGATRRFCSEDIEAFLPPPGTPAGDAWAEFGVIPCLRSIGETPVKLDPKNPGIGTRATLSVTFQDFLFPDGTGYYFARTKSSGQYVENRIAKVYRGYLTDPFDWSNFIEETWIIDSLSYPNEKWQVNLTLRDVLSRGTNDKATAPAASIGKLERDISSLRTRIEVVTNDPTEYDFRSGLDYGYVRINDEIIRYERIDITSTGVELRDLGRGDEGSERASHEEGDTVQWCLPFENESAADIINYLYTEYSGVDPSYIDVAQWKSDLAVIGDPLYTTTLVSPNSVNKLVNEVCAHLQAYVWWDPVAAQIRLKPLTPIIADTTYNTRENITGGSVSISEVPNERVSRMYVYYGQRLRTEKLDQLSNYRVVDIVVDADSESNYQEERPREVWSRWLTRAQENEALAICNRYISTYSETPIRIGFEVAAKDGDFDLGDVLNVEVPFIQDIAGIPKTVAVQVITRTPAKDNTTVKYVAQNFAFSQSYGLYAPDSGITDKWVDASEAERLTYCYYGDDDGQNPDGSTADRYF